MLCGRMCVIQYDYVFVSNGVVPQRTKRGSIGFIGARDQGKRKERASPPKYVRTFACPPSEAKYYS